MSAANIDIQIEKYATFVLNLQVKSGQGASAAPANISAYTPRMQIRASADEQEILLEFNTTNGRIQVVDATQGKLRIVLPADETANISWESAAYDLVLINGINDTRRIIQGGVTVSAGVTR